MKNIRTLKLSLIALGSLVCLQAYASFDVTLRPFEAQFAVRKGTPIIRSAKLSLACSYGVTFMTATGGAKSVDSPDENLVIEGPSKSVRHGAEVNVYRLRSKNTHHVSKWTVTPTGACEAALTVNGGTKVGYAPGRPNLSFNTKEQGDVTSSVVRQIEDFVYYQDPADKEITFYFP